MLSLEHVPSPKLGSRSHADSYYLRLRTLRVIALSALLVSTQAIPVISAAGRAASGAATTSAEKTIKPPPYDCTWGGQITRGQEEGLNEGIKAAIDLLGECPACKQFLGGEDTIELLKKLRDDKRFVVSNYGPEYFAIDRVNNRYRFGPFRKLPMSTVARIVDFIPARNSLAKGTYARPCIYVNAARLLAINEPIPEGNNRTLREERALVVLHELAHVVDVIYREDDGTPNNEKSVELKSRHNTVCVIGNCFPCAKASTACPPYVPPAKTSASKRGKPPRKTQRRQM